MLSFSTHLFAFNKMTFNFGKLMIVNNKYLIPSKPEPKSELKKFIYVKLREQHPTFKVKSQYEKLSEQQIKEYQEQREKEIKQLEEWKTKFSWIPKLAPNEYFVTRQFIVEKFPEHASKPGESARDAVVRLSKVLQEKKDYIEQHKEAILKRVEEQKKQFEKQKEEFDSKYLIPEKIKKNGISLQYLIKQKKYEFRDVTKHLKDLTQEDLAHIDKIVQAEEANYQNRLQQLSKQFGLTVEELLDEIKQNKQKAREEKKLKQQKNEKEKVTEQKTN